MDISIWILVGALMKLGIYLCAGLLLGTLLTHRLAYPDYLQLSIFSLMIIALSGLALSLMSFLVQVGSFNEAGFMGMWDQEIGLMLWDSSVGDNTFYRVFAFVLFGLALCFKRYYVVFITANTLASLSLLYAFILVGHIAELSWLSKIILALHVLIALIWMGSLYPLYRLCQSPPPQRLYPIMHRFGRIAAYSVPILLLAGLWLLYQLLTPFALETIFSSYGITLLMKLLLVSLILLLAAFHKFKLVPQLKTSNTAHSLQRSIAIEIILGLSILALTALLSSAMTPHSI